MASPVTSTVSDTCPGFSEMSTRRSVATSTTTLLVTEVWNPACETVTAYVPMGNSEMV